MQFTNSNYYFTSVRAAAILTGSYVPGTVLGGSNQKDSTLESLFRNNQLVALFQVTLGSLTTVDIKIEFSNDGTTWYQEAYDAIGTPASSAVTITESLITRSFAASGNYRVAIPMLDQFCRISAKGTGTVTSSSLTIDAVVGTN